MRYRSARAEKNQYGEGEDREKRKKTTHDNLLILCQRLLILELVLRCVVDLDAVVGNVAQDACLELEHLLVGHRVGLGDDGDEVDAGVEAAHELDVDGLEAASGGRG